MTPGIPTLEDIMTWKQHKRQFMYQVQGEIDLQKLLDYSNRPAISAFHCGEDCYFSFANDEQDVLEMIMMMVIIIHSSVPDPDN